MLLIHIETLKESIEVPGNTGYVQEQHWSFPAQQLVYQQHLSEKFWSALDHKDKDNQMKVDSLSLLK
jgi:hypothetical protein